MNNKWVTRSITTESTGKSPNKVSSMIRFFIRFFDHLGYKPTWDVDDTLDRKKRKKCMYKNTVLDLLHSTKEDKSPQSMSLEEKKKLQKEIENQTLSFDEASIHKASGNILKKLISPKLPSARDFIKSHPSIKLNDEDLKLLSEFGHYTIEAIIVYVISLVFKPDNWSSLIRLSTLIEQFESAVRHQGKLLASRNQNNPLPRSDPDAAERARAEYPFGRALAEFTSERGLIYFDNTGASPVEIKVQTNKGKYYLPKNIYVIANIDLAILPIKLNLPMVCPPLDWKSALPDGGDPKHISDLVGGYLSAPSGEIYDRYRLFTSGDISNFYIKLSNSKELCKIINKLQRQPFRINTDFLKYLKSNYQDLVDNGLLMPSFLSSLNIKEMADKLRKFHYENPDIRGSCNFNELLNILYGYIQRSNYEQLIVKLAIAYEGYDFYLPAFIDFRGRIYRSGVLHFHDRDLARGMLLFSGCGKEDLTQNKLVYLLKGASFHYKGFSSLQDFENWLESHYDEVLENRVQFACSAKRPFQFISSIVAYTSPNGIAKYSPITQDASASAYQLMSYFLLDGALAYRTNLIPSSDGIIQDIYSFMLDELKGYMKTHHDNPLTQVVRENLTRKIVKRIFMPLIYGKTLKSTADDLKESLSMYLAWGDHNTLAKICFEFWERKYPKLNALIGLIRSIGNFVSAGNRSVEYSVPFYTTVQDYKRTVPAKIWVYERLHKKRRQVTLRVPTLERDPVKSAASTFVNFIHQKDAYIAMKVVQKILEQQAPIYTVHDNFITTPQYCGSLPEIYINIFRNELGPPLNIINDFIVMNLICPFLETEAEKLFIQKHFQYNLIEWSHLESYLDKGLPNKMSSSQRKTWTGRKTKILNYYDRYITAVCGSSPRVHPKPQQLWASHARNWEEYKSLINPDKRDHYLLCLHN